MVRLASYIPIEKDEADVCDHDHNYDYDYDHNNDNDNNQGLGVESGQEHENEDKHVKGKERRSNLVHGRGQVGGLPRYPKKDNRPSLRNGPKPPLLPQILPMSGNVKNTQSQSQSQSALQPPQI